MLQLFNFGTSKYIYLMKKLFLLFAFVVVYANAFAQITFTLSDVASANQTQRIAIDTFPLPTINFGNKGANQVYDFSNLTLYKYDTIEYRTPTTGQLNTCPNADVATTTDGINFLLTNTDNANSKLTLEGFEGQLVPGSTLSAAYTTKPDLFRFPTTYQSNFSGTGYLQKAVPGSAVNQPVNQVRLTVNTTYTDTIDGWGKVITPLGVYKCLRKKRTEITTTLIEIQLLPISPWTTISNTTSTTTRYSYITKEAKGSVINFNYDTANVLQSVSWSMVPPTAPVADFSFVNPSAGVVNFTDLSDNYPTTWDWDFGDGATSHLQNPTHNFAANGTYAVCLTVTNAGGSDNICKQINITGIAPGNNAPVAVDDTFSVLQATSIIKLVANNDVDPDGDSLCITDVWGTPSVKLQPGGSCRDIYYLSDTCFNGTQTVYYSICDNGSPALCDTAMVTVTVIPNTAYYSNAFFEIDSLVHDCTSFSLANGSSNFQSSIWTVEDFTSGDSTSYTSVNLSNIAFDDLDFNGEICVTANGKCNADQFCDTTSILCTAIDDLLPAGSRIYPNPTSQQLTVESEEIKSGMLITILSAIGQEVFNLKTTTNQQVEMSLPLLQKGLYYIQLLSQDGISQPLGKFSVVH